MIVERIILFTIIAVVIITTILSILTTLDIFKFSKRLSIITMVYIIAVVCFYLSILVYNTLNRIYILF